MSDDCAYVRGPLPEHKWRAVEAAISGCLLALDQARRVGQLRVTRERLARALGLTPRDLTPGALQKYPGRLLSALSGGNIIAAAEALGRGINGYNALSLFRDCLQNEIGGAHPLANTDERYWRRRARELTSLGQNAFAHGDLAQADEVLVAAWKILFPLVRRDSWRVNLRHEDSLVVPALQIGTAHLIRSVQQSQLTLAHSIIPEMRDMVHTFSQTTLEWLISKRDAHLAIAYAFRHLADIANAKDYWRRSALLEREAKDEFPDEMQLVSWGPVNRSRVRVHTAALLTSDTNFVDAGRLSIHVPLRGQWVKALVSAPIDRVSARELVLSSITHFELLILSGEYSEANDTWNVICNSPCTTYVSTTPSERSAMAKLAFAEYLSLLSRRGPDYFSGISDFESDPRLTGFENLKHRLLTIRAAAADGQSDLLRWSVFFDPSFSGVPHSGYGRE